LHPHCVIFRKVKRIASLKKWKHNHQIVKKNYNPESVKAKPNVIRRVYFKALNSGFICPDCGMKMVLGGNQYNSSSIDHILSRGMGGGNEESNLRIICMRCNRLKSKNENPEWEGIRKPVPKPELRKVDPAPGENDSILSHLLYHQKIKSGG
jgi:5-methylcytosine-specific restriction endonuclease McrA